MTDEAVAAIDVGTNTVLLLVARRAADGGLEVLEDRCVTARLGAGLARTGALEPAARARTLELLLDFAARATAHGVPRARTRAVGTAVLRRARDGAEFARACSAQLGFALDVLSEEDEARLGFEAAAAESGPETVVVDVGGGSTEVVAARGSQRMSAPVGALVLTERYLGRGGEAPAAAGGWDALLAEVRAACARFPAGAGARAPVVLLGGTASNLACLELGTGAFDPARAEGAVVPGAAAERWAEELARVAPAARAAFPIETDRLEILPAGLACIAGALARLAAPRARVTGRGLRYGLAASMLA
jgi:exopolyphosphatase/guanosine-5'-triphosphate,3'-diphosphate pyrophosphatase